jgi:hypothetical protein
MRSTVLNQATGVRPAHPNDLDLRRIANALEKRRRYKYVTPSVFPTVGGYKIQSPCCSRNIDPDGGVIDVALLLYDHDGGSWRLLRKNHGLGLWEVDSVHDRLAQLLSYLNDDPERRFWQ